MFISSAMPFGVDRKLQLHNRSPRDLKSSFKESDETDDIYSDDFDDDDEQSNQSTVNSQLNGKQRKIRFKENPLGSPKLTTSPYRTRPPRPPRRPPTMLSVVEEVILKSRMARDAEHSNIVSELRQQLKDLSDENQTLRRVARRHEQELEKSDSADLGRILNLHDEEVKSLQETIRRYKERYEDARRSSKMDSERLDRSRSEVGRLKRIVEQRDLSSRTELSKQVEELSSELDTKERKIETLERYGTNLENNFKSQIQRHVGKQKQAERKCQDLTEKIAELQKLIEEKDRALQMQAAATGLRREPRRASSLLALPPPPSSSESSRDRIREYDRIRRTSMGNGPRRQTLGVVTPISYEKKRIAEITANCQSSTVVNVETVPLSTKVDQVTSEPSGFIMITNPNPIEELETLSCTHNVKFSSAISNDNNEDKKPSEEDIPATKPELPFSQEKEEFESESPAATSVTSVDHSSSQPSAPSEALKTNVDCLNDKRDTSSPSLMSDVSTIALNNTTKPNNENTLDLGPGYDYQPSFLCGPRPESASATMEWSREEPLRHFSMKAEKEAYDDAARRSRFVGLQQAKEDEDHRKEALLIKIKALDDALNGPEPELPSEMKFDATIQQIKKEGKLIKKDIVSPELPPVTMPPGRTASDRERQLLLELFGDKTLNKEKPPKPREMMKRPAAMPWEIVVDLEKECENL